MPSSAQTILITGCSSGLGRAAATYFAEKGWNVIATMRQPHACTDFSSFGNVLVAPLDVTDTSSIASAIDAGIAHFGAIDAIVNNAGIGVAGVFECIPIEQVRAQFEVNLFGLMNVTRAILPHFRMRKSGTVVNISSGSGIFTVPASSLYCASKFAVEGFSESLAYELASQGIRVRIIEPGGVFSTGFFETSAQAAQDNCAIPDYDAFVAHTAAFFQALGAELGATEDEVSACIFHAVTDPSDRLRYVATRDIESLIRERHERPESEYIAAMRARFERSRPSSDT